MSNRDQLDDATRAEFLRYAAGAPGELRVGGAASHAAQHVGVKAGHLQGSSAVHGLSTAPDHPGPLVCWRCLTWPDPPPPALPAADTVLRALRLVDATVLRSSLRGSERDESAKALSAAEVRVNAALGALRLAQEEAAATATEVVTRLQATLPAVAQLVSTAKLPLSPEAAGAGVQVRARPAVGASTGAWASGWRLSPAACIQRPMHDVSAPNPATPKQAEDSAAQVARAEVAEAETQLDNIGEDPEAAIAAAQRLAHGVLAGEPAAVAEVEKLFQFNPAAAPCVPSCPLLSAA